MNTVNLKTIRNHTYAGHSHRVGDRYQAPENHARLMVAMHNSVIDESDQPLPPVPYETKVEEVEVSPRTGKPKRAYKRRDMRAER